MGGEGGLGIYLPVVEVQRCPGPRRKLLSRSGTFLCCKPQEIMSLYAAGVSARGTGRRRFPSCKSHHSRVK